MKYLWLLLLVGCQKTVISPLVQVKYRTTVLSRGEFDLPWEARSEIDQWILHYTQKNNQSFKTALKRGEAYIPYIRQELKQNNLPQDLVFLALIESGFNNSAQSGAKALGMWQFMPQTAKSSKLQVSTFIDERRSPQKSTITAIKYLNYLHEQFPDWHLTMAAYNFGEGNLRKVMRKSGINNYWELSRLKLLPKETRDYVPKILAAMLVVKNSNEFKLNYDHSLDYWSLVEKQGWQLSNNFFKKVSFPMISEKLNANFLKYETVEDMDLFKLAKILRIPYSKIKEANPEIITWFAPKGTILLLPPQAKNAQALLDTYSAWLTPQFKEIQIKKSMKLTVFAKEMNVNPVFILALNPKLHNQQNLLGKTVRIPVPQKTSTEFLGVEANPKKLVSIN